MLNRRTTIIAVAAATVVGAGTAAGIALANPAGGDLVISEAYVNGGSANASYVNKFVELFNPTGEDIGLTGKSLQYRAPTSTVTPSGAQVFALSGTVAAHGHFLIQLPSNGANGAALPTPDLSTGGSINPGAGGGTLFIATGTAGVVPTDPAVIDKIGWGTSNSPEGTAISGNSVTLSYQRDDAGTDTDNNAADFTVAAPHPQDAASDTPPVEPTGEPSSEPSQEPSSEPSQEPSQTPSPTGVAPIVINEVYGGGGNSGATLTNDFVELFNPTTAAVDLTGWSVQYRSATGGGAPITALTGAIPAGGFFLVQEAAGSGGSTALPAPDVTGTANMSATNGEVILSNGTTAITAIGNLVGVAGVVDAIGFGTANSYESAATPALTNTTSAARTNGVDTDNNAADFTTGAPTPTNAAGQTLGGGDTGGGTGTRVTIADIQGTGTSSPIQGQRVTTQGVVTAVYATGGFDGFYLQTGGPDLTPGASDAVFVYGSISAQTVTIGESVQVTATVSEYQGLTELDEPTVTPLASALPEVQPYTGAWSTLSTEAGKEAHEGELIAPQGDFTVSDNYDTNWYGSFTLAAGDTPLHQPTDVGPAGSPAAVAAQDDNAARMITLDDGSSHNYSFSPNNASPLPWLTLATPDRVGSAVTFHQPVILDWRYSLWNFQPTLPVYDDGAAVATFSDTQTANQTPATVGGDIRLATFNVENFFTTTGEKYIADGLGGCTWYDDRQGNHIAVNTCQGPGNSAGPRGAANQASLDRQVEKIVTGINRLDASVVSLEEVENSVKFNQPRDTALSYLVDALNAAAGANVWAFVPSPPDNALPPLADQDVIRTAIIYKPSAVAPVGSSTVLTGAASFGIAREPLAQAFKKVGAADSDAFLIVANHFKSKGADAAAGPGDTEDSSSPAVDQGAFNATRVQEATDVVAFANTIASGLGTDRVFILGDLNAYTQEDPLQVFYQAGYTDLGSRFDPTEQTYSFNSLAGSLDHVLASPAALAMVTGADVWEINAQEAIAFAYSRYNYNVTPLFDGGVPFAASDHDPVVVGLTLPSQPAVPAWSATTVYLTGDTVSYNGSTWLAQWWSQNQAPGDPNGPWEEIKATADGTAIWTPSRVFVGGDLALYDGHIYRAQWWTRNQPPTTPHGPWTLVS